MTGLASNTLTVMAGRIRDAQDRATAASVEAAEQSLKAGRLLIEAKAECRHGEWGPFLEAAGMHERRARRLMQLARSGLKSDTVSDLGGIREALRLLALLDAEGSTSDPQEIARMLIHGRILNDAEAECPGIVRATLDRVAAEGADDILAAFWRAMGHPEIALEEAGDAWPF